MSNLNNRAFSTLSIPDSYIAKWQKTVDLLAKIFEVPAGLIMRIRPSQIEVFVSSRTENNPYKATEKANLNTGLYCETVLSTGKMLEVPNALSDKNWKDNPDVKLHMISYLGIPILWPDKKTFGTICVLDEKTRNYSLLYKELLQQFKELIEADLFSIVQSNELIRLNSILKEEKNDVLEKSDSLLQQIAENYPNSFLSIIEKDYSIGFTSGQEFKKLNLDPRQFIGLSLEEVFGEQTSIVKEYYERTFKGEECTFELFINNQFQIHKTVPLFSGNGTIDQILVVAENITKRKREETINAAQWRFLDFAQDHTVRELLQKILDEAEALTGSCIGFFHFMEEDQKTLTLETWSTNTLEFMCTAEGSGSHYPVSKAGVWAECILKRRPVIHNDYASLKHRKGLPAGHAPIFRELVVPLFREKQIVAVLGVGNKEIDYDKEDVHTVQRLADIAWEIVERKLTDRKLQESDAKFREAQRIAKVGSWELDLVTNSFQWSDEVYRLFGLEPRQFDGSYESFLGNIHPDDRNLVNQTYRESVEKKEPYNIIHRILLKDGTIKIVNERCVTFYDDSGNAMKSLGTIQDITEQKLVEEELRKLGAAIDQSPVSIVITDITGCIEYVNPKFCELTGYSEGEVLGSNPRILHSDETPKEDYNQLWEQILSGKTWRGEFHNKKKNGELYWEDATISPILNEKGEITHILAVKEDITKRKLMEEEKALLQEQVHHHSKLEALGQLAGGMAHDFNNSLSGIMGAAQLLKSPKRTIDEKGIKYVDMIIQASIRAADLTAKLLAFGRKGKMTSTTVDLHDVLHETAEILGRTIDKKIIITIEATADNHTIVGDSTGLQNAFLNLCINSSHSIDDGGEIQIITKNIVLNESYCKASLFNLEPGEYCQVVVRDSGCGIPDKDLKKIFDPFYTTKESGKGTGLGLSVVYGTILDHHGAINVYSEEGKGTAFHILVPCSVQTVTHRQNNEDIVSGSGTILLVDDEELIRITGKNMLEEMGYQVLLAENGLEAVNIFQRHFREINCVIMDNNMPIMNGREAFYAMKEIDNNCKIIISSGFTKEENIHELEEQGLAGYIGKPYRNYKLSQIIAETLRAEQ